MPELDPAQQRANNQLLAGWVTMIICGVLSFAMFGKLGCEIRDYRAARQSATWSAVKGRVLEATVLKEKFVRSRSTGSGTTRGGGGVTGGSTSTSVEWGYKPHVRYRYQVSGRTYEGQRIELTLGWDMHSSGKRRVEHRLASYPVGGTVTVYYNPKKPAESLLIKGVTTERASGLWFFSIITALFLLGTGIGFWLRAKGKAAGGFIENDG